MNIQATSSPGLPTLSRAGAMVDQRTTSAVADAAPQFRRPTRLIGGRDLHATFVYTSAAEPRPSAAGRQVDIYV